MFFSWPTQSQKAMGVKLAHLPFLKKFFTYCVKGLLCCRAMLKVTQVAPDFPSLIQYKAECPICEGEYKRDSYFRRKLGSVTQNPLQSLLSPDSSYSPSYQALRHEHIFYFFLSRFSIKIGYLKFIQSITKPFMFHIRALVLKIWNLGPSNAIIDDASEKKKRRPVLYKDFFTLRLPISLINRPTNLLEQMSFAEQAASQCRVDSRDPIQGASWNI